jgi:hypothetical protein
MANGNIPARSLAKLSLSRREFYTILLRATILALVFLMIIPLVGHGITLFYVFLFGCSAIAAHYKKKYAPLFD